MSSSSCNGAERRGWWRPVGACVPVALLLVGCGNGGAAAPVADGSTPVIVEADVFSGRVNPTWPMTAAEAGDLQTLLEGLPSTIACPNPPRDGLGFRGFGVAGLTVNGQTTRRIGVDASCVRLEFVDGTQRQLLDRDYTAQEFLITFAADRDPSMRTILASS